MEWTRFWATAFLFRNQTASDDCSFLSSSGGFGAFTFCFCPEFCTFLMYTGCEIAYCVSLGPGFCWRYQGMDVIQWHFVRLLKSEFSLTMAGGNYFCLFASDTGEDNLGLLFQLFQDTFCSVWQEGKKAFSSWRNNQPLLSPTDGMHFLTWQTVLQPQFLNDFPLLPEWTFSSSWHWICSTFF